MHIWNERFVHITTTNVIKLDSHYSYNVSKVSLINMVIGFRNNINRNLLQTKLICYYILVYICWYIFGSVDGHHNGPERLFPDLDDLPLAFLLVMIHPGAIKNKNCLYQVFLAISCHIFQLFIAKHFFLK